MRRASVGGLSLVTACALLGCDGAPGGAGPAASTTSAPSTGQTAAAQTVTAAAASPEERELTALLGPTIPPDVDPAVLAKLKKEGKTARIQELYDRLSWQAFVALNWPTDDAGKPKAKLGDAGSPAWMQWKESFDVFREDGAKPAPWGEARKLLGGKPTPKMAALADAEKIPRHERLLFTPFAAKKHATTADELDQAFTFPLWDQSGNIVYYEVLLNRSEFDYLVTNELYNIDGQIAFSKKNPGKDLDPKNCNHPNKTVVVMPSGKFGSKEDGAIEIKLAWKTLAAADIAERYFVADGYVPEDITLTGSCAKGDLSASIEGKKWKKVKLGLVGFHISHKTESGPQWVWSTFEQVDNLAVDGLEAEKYSAEGKTLKPSFNDPSCPTCAVNTCAAPPQKSQLQRVIPIDPETAALNRAMQRLLGAQGSRLRYYELIGTQYPTAPDADPTSPRAEPNCSGTDANPINLPESVANKPGGKPHPVFLTNMTMESFFQQGNQPACNPVENGNCPAPLPANAPTVFATESCMGCHSSSAIATGGTPHPGTQTGATYGHQLTADFSWLLRLKAYWKK